MKPKTKTIMLVVLLAIVGACTDDCFEILMVPEVQDAPAGGLS